MNEKILKARDKHKSIPDEDEDTKTQQEDGEDDAEMTKHFGLLKTHKCSQAQKSCANMKWLQNEEVMVASVVVFSSPYLVVSILVTQLIFFVFYLFCC